MSSLSSQMEDTIWGPLDSPPPQDPFKIGLGMMADFVCSLKSYVPGCHGKTKETMQLWGKVKTHAEVVFSHYGWD